MKKQKFIELVIDEEDMNGVDTLAIVHDPAIEMGFITLNKQKSAPLTLAKMNHERRLAVGPALIPEKMINRYDEDGDEFFIYFSKETVRKAAYLFLKANRQSSANIEHEQPFEGATVVESWIVEGMQDKSKHLGFDVPNGTWMVAMYIDNDEVWEMAKNGTVRGFSIEGYFSNALSAKMSKPVELESYSDYPEAVSNNAKRGIELNEKVGNKCAERTGKIRAQQLAQKEAISLDVIKRMYSFLSRAQTYYDESDSEACGTISFLLWGGKAGLRWAESKLKELGEIEAAKDQALVDELAAMIHEEEH